MSLTKSSPAYYRAMDELFEEQRRNPQPDHTHELYHEHEYLIARTVIVSDPGFGDEVESITMVN